MKPVRVLALALGVAIACVLAAGFAFLVRRADPTTRLVRFEASVEELYRDRERYAAAWQPETAPPGRRHLPRFPIPESIGQRLFPLDARQQLWDELTYIRRPANTDYTFAFREYPGGRVRFRTNSLGMRESAEPSATKPDLRILVTGDSHTEGVCNNVESFPHVLRRALAKDHPAKSIECLNSGHGFFTFYSYLGTLERFAYLEPDVFVVAVYVPNDFVDVVPLYHFFEGTPWSAGSRAYQEAMGRATEKSPGWVAQDGISLKFFDHYPEEVAVAMHAAKLAVQDIQELCESRGIRLVFALLPSFFDVERARGWPDAEIATLARYLHGVLGIGPEAAGVHDRFAKELQAFLAERKIPCLDALPLFAARKERMYWLADHHISTAAHAALGEALVPFVNALEPSGLR